VRASIDQLHAPHRDARLVTAAALRGAAEPAARDSLAAEHAPT
jgi:hypothetical protein